jgi:GATA-binding protein 4
MNNCLQNGYFGGSFSSLHHHHSPGDNFLPPGGQKIFSSDMAGYHHQHNVIQAAKLMASS